MKHGAMEKYVRVVNPHDPVKHKSRRKGKVGLPACLIYAREHKKLQRLSAMSDGKL